MDEEIWRWISGFEGIYEVSSHGRIRSTARDVFCGPYGGMRAVESRILSTHGRPGQRLRAQLSDGSGRELTVAVHRVVAETFIPNPLGWFYVLHGPGGRHDNSVGNLRWSSMADLRRLRDTKGRYR